MALLFLNNRVRHKNLPYIRQKPLDIFKTNQNILKGKYRFNAVQICKLHDLLSPYMPDDTLQDIKNREKVRTVKD